MARPCPSWQMNHFHKAARSWQDRFAPRELVAIGIFAAAAKTATLVIALAGGGMNPLTLMLKNAVYTTLVVVMLCKVRKGGTLVLFTAANLLVSLLLLGGSVTLIPTAFAAAAAAELAMAALGGVRSTKALFIGVALNDLLSKALSLGVSLLYLRESPALAWVAVPIVAIGYAGCICGLFSGARLSKELRHAGILRS